MPQSLCHVLLHLVFSTKNRTPWIEDPALRNELHAYIVGILQNLHSPSLIVNGVEDHVHILFRSSRTLPIAKVVEQVKIGSSKWLKTKDTSLKSFAWQGGYAVFSVSASVEPQVRSYIANQEEHHRRMTFQDELRAMLDRHGVSFDERYVWD